MNGIQVSLYTAGLALGVFAAGVLRGKVDTRRRGPDFLTWFLLVEAAGFGLELLMSHPATPLKSLWLGLRLASSLLAAPCLWLAVREMVEGARPSIASLGRRQLSLVGAGMLLTLPVIERAHWGVTYVNSERVTNGLHLHAIQGTMLACIAIFAWQVPHFLGRCQRLINGQDGQARLTALERGWLRLAWAILAAAWLIGLMRTLHCMLIGYRLDFGPVFALAEVGVAVGAIYTIVRQAVKSPTPADMRESEKTGAEAHAAPEAKYARSRLAPAVRARIKQKIEAALQAEEVYGDSLLSLRTLSAVLKEKPHYVSQVINQDFGTNFYELVNRRRIERAKELLVAAPERTVLEIALAVGFNAKSTFNTAFRQQMGITPSQFRPAETPKSAD